MATFSFVLNTLKSAYDGYVTAKAATEAAQATLDAVGAKPSYPTIVVTNSDWNSVTTAIAAWQSSYDTALNALELAKSTQRTAETVVFEAMGYVAPPSTPYTLGVMYDEWVKVVGAGGGILTYTHWIGFSRTSLYLQVETSQPTLPFPNV